MLARLAQGEANVSDLAEPFLNDMSLPAVTKHLKVLENAGLFAVPANGRKAYDKLERAGLPVFTEVLNTSKGQRTRVRVGPYPTKAKADAAARKVRALKLDANVFKH